MRRMVTGGQMPESSKGQPGRDNRRDAVILCAAAAVGAISVAGGWIIQGRGYMPSLLLQVGSSLVLVVPLLWLGRLMEARLRRAEERSRAISASLTDIRARVDETATRLGELGALSRQDVAEQHTEDLRAADIAEEQFSRGNLLHLAERAISRHAIARDGVRVRVPGTECWLRLRADSPGAGEKTLKFILEGRDGATAATIAWAEGETPSGVTARLAEALVACNAHPSENAHLSEEASDISAMFRRLLNTIRTGLQHQEPGAHRLGPLVEMPNDEWAIAEDGLYKLDRPYYIPFGRITNSNEDWDGYMAGITGVDHDKFMDAYRTAIELIPHARSPR